MIYNNSPIFQTTSKQSFNSTQTHDTLSNIEKGKIFIEKHAAGIEYNHELQTFVPKNADAINQIWLENRDKINNALGPITPKDSIHSADGGPGSFTWENDFKSVDELHEMATKSAPSFMTFLNRIASDVGATTTYGPNNKFVVKSKNGLVDKINNRMFFSSNPVGQVNDTLRGTIIVENIAQVKQLIEHLNIQTSNNNMKIAYSNKFEADYPEGYVGIHARLQYKTDDGRNILSEIQIHFSDIENGTSDCPSQATHHTYEIIRSLAQTNLSLNDQSELRQKGNLASKAQFAFGMSRVLEKV